MTATYITTTIPYVNAPAYRARARTRAGRRAAEYGTDAVRWWLLREVPRVGDADFTVARLVARADDELANGLGNLVSRVVAMIGKYRDGRVPEAGLVPPGGEDLDAAIRQAGDRVGAALDEFDFRRATAPVWAIADEANRFVNRVRPWDLARAERAGQAPARLDAVLALLARACSALGRELLPFLPDAAARITAGARPGTGGSRHRPRCSAAWPQSASASQLARVRAGCGTAG